MLSLTEEQWELIQTVELNVFVDDGEGFIDMGLDNIPWPTMLRHRGGRRLRPGPSPPC